MASSRGRTRIRPTRSSASWARAHKLIWGGNWGNLDPKAKHGFIDTDHVQRVKVADQHKLFAGAATGKWYPPDNYDPWK